MVLAGDNLLDFSIKGFVDFANKKNGNAVMRHFEDNISKLQRTGIAVIDDNDKIIDMQEKPKRA